MLTLLGYITPSARHDFNSAGCRCVVLGKMIKSREVRVSVQANNNIERARIYLQLGYTYYAFVWYAARIWWESEKETKFECNHISGTMRDKQHMTCEHGPSKVLHGHNKLLPSVCVYAAHRRISLHKSSECHTTMRVAIIAIYSSLVLLKRVRDLPMPSLPAREPHQCASNNNFP